VRLVWTTDIHLDFARQPALEQFFASILAAQPDAVLITGDLGEAYTWSGHLSTIEDRLQKPVWFVLGNHDFYRSSIAAVREQAKSKTGYLPSRGVVLISESTALVGHDGWADSRLGDYYNSNVMLNDYLLIAELVTHSRHLRRKILEKLGDEAAEYLRHWLPLAAERRDHILIATHVPPFKNACWHEGQISADDWLPHFTCAATGDAILDAADAFPEKQFTVCCGHTHGAGEVHMRPNLHVITGGAVYGAPAINQIFDF
jgi:Icc protein